MWDHTAVTAESQLVVGLVVGKQTSAQPRALVHDAKRRLRSGHVAALWTDAYAGIRPAMERARASGKPSCVNVILDPDIYSSGTMNQTMYK